jgi:protein SCO1/2
MRTPSSRRAAAALGVAAVCAALSLAPVLAAGAPPGSPWGERYFPNVELVTQDGKKVRFYDDLVRDKHVVVSFVYTRCEKVCGLMTANLVRVQRVLGDRVGKDIHFYSVSLDPERDTPAVLRDYARSYRAGPGWTFLTGRAEDVALLRRRFGDLTPVEDHAPRVNVGHDPTGQWWATSALDDPGYLANVIGGWMDPRFDGSARVAAQGYAKVPKVAALGPGQRIFREKCAACHVAGGRSVGPDLAGVATRRDERWLARWIKAPDDLLRAKDPIALELLARHGGVPMPNLRLSDAQVAEVIAFLKASDPTRAAAAATATSN